MLSLNDHDQGHPARENLTDLPDIFDERVARNCLRIENSGLWMKFVGYNRLPTSFIPPSWMSLRS